MGFLEFDEIVSDYSGDYSRSNGNRAGNSVSIVSRSDSMILENLPRDLVRRRKFAPLLSHLNFHVPLVH